MRLKQLVLLRTPRVQAGPIAAVAIHTPPTPVPQMPPIGVSFCEPLGYHQAKFHVELCWLTRRSPRACVHEWAGRLQHRKSGKAGIGDHALVQTLLAACENLSKGGGPSEEFLRIALKSP